MKSRFFSNIIFLFLMGILSNLDGQMLSFRKYTIDDGLNQTEVSGSMMMFDSSYYVWETNKTLSLFDGYSFEHFDSVGFSPYVINNYYNTSAATYFYDGGMIYYDGKSFRNITPPWEERGYYFQEGRAFMVNENYQVFYFDTLLLDWKYEKDINPIIRSRIQNKERYVESNDGRYISVLSGNDYEFFEKTSEGIGKINPADIIDIKEEDFLKTFNQSDYNHFEYNSRFKIKYFQPPFTNNYVVATSKAGDFLLVERNNLKILGKVSHNTDHIHEINDQCVMLSTHAGLLKVNPKIKYFKSGEENMVSSLHTIFEDDRGNIWFGGYGDGLCYWDGIEMKKAHFLIGGKVMPGAASIKNKGIYLLCDGISRGLYQLKDNQISNLSFTIKERVISGFYIRQLNNGDVAIGLSKYGLGIIRDDSLHIISKEKGLNLKNVLAIAEDSRGRLWCMGSGLGVGVYDTNNDTAITYNVNKEIKHHFGGMTIHYDDKDRMWFGSFNGLKVLENASSFDLENDNLFDYVKTISLPNGETSIITSVSQVDNYLVIGNNSAVSFLDLISYDIDANNPKIYQLIYGEDIQGGGSEQNAILLDSKRRLWIGGQDGANVIEWDSYTFDMSTNKIKIKSASAGNEYLNSSNIEEIKLPIDNRNCKITFGPDKNISLLKNIFFDYHLLNKHGDTLSSVWYDQKGVFESSYIPPGEYKLVIKAKKHGQLMDSKSIKIYAPLSLSENPNFWGGLGALLIGLLSWLYIFRATQMRKNAEKELELSKLKYDKESLQVQTIISSFNPHFINNSLHWAQSRYRKDDELVKVLGRLSENIRYIFQNTRKGNAFHSLQDELNLIENYIEIQKIRFKNSFEYRSPAMKGKEYLLNHKVLLLQLQIHVENAIEHGLRNREGSTYVSLRITDNIDQINVIIEDDGIGRNGAEMLGSRGTQSGTSMISELTAIFNSKNKQSITTIYEDDIFLDEEGVKYGTRVIINIPKDYNFDL